MDVRVCLERGLLKKDFPSMEKALRSLEIAKRRLAKAQQLLGMRMLDMAEVNAYTALFHASRALLFRDGYKERSHYAISVYLQERYADLLEPRFLTELNLLRQNRHEIFYGLEDVELDHETVREQIRLAEDYIRAVEKLVSGSV